LDLGREYDRGVNESGSEWSQRGIGGRFRERLLGTRATRIGPLFIALGIIVAARIVAANDLNVSGLLRDSGRWVALPVTYQPRAVSIEGTIRCEEMIRSDNGSHAVIGKNLILRNNTSALLPIAIVFREWSGRTHRTSFEFETLVPHGRATSFVLLSPPQPGVPNVPVPQPIAAGVTRCDIAIWVAPTIRLEPLRNPTAPCARAIATVQANQVALSSDALIDDSVRRCRSPEDWEAAWFKQTVDQGFPAIQFAAPLDDELAMRCFDADRMLGKTRVCRALVAESDQEAAAFATSP
jgi:hypothetical protein